MSSKRSANAIPMERVLCCIKNEPKEKIDLIAGHDYILAGSETKGRRFFLRYWQLGANGLVDVHTVPLWETEALNLAMAIIEETDTKTANAVQTKLSFSKKEGK